MWAEAPNPSIEQTATSRLRRLAAAAHVERWAGQWALTKNEQFWWLGALLKPRTEIRKFNLALVTRALVSRTAASDTKFLALALPTGLYCLISLRSTRTLQ